MTKHNPSDPLDHDDKIVVKQPCSVSMYDMQFQLLLDGRERGLWTRLYEADQDRRLAHYKWYHEGVREAIAEVATGLDELTRIRLQATIDMKINHLIDRGADEMALIEWPELVQIHKRLGAQIEKAKKTTLFKEQTAVRKLDEENQ